MSADTNAGGWPDADKPGVPMNPGRDGWHWLRVRNSQDEVVAACLWELEEWSVPGSMATISLEDIARHGEAVQYLGPCLTPSEIAAREAAAAMAMREMAVDDRAKLAKLIEDFYAPWGAWKTVWWEGEVGDCKPFGPDNLLHEIAARLSRALPLPAAAQAALDAVVREAVMREREALAEMVEVWPVDAAAEAYSIFEITDRDADIAAAIRARGEAE